MRKGELVQAVGARRRLGHLMLTGWPLSQIAPYSGIARDTLQEIVYGRKLITLVTADAIDAAYGDLIGFLPDTTTKYGRASSTRATQYARRHRFGPVPDGDDPAPPRTCGTCGESVAVRRRVSDPNVLSCKTCRKARRAELSAGDVDPVAIERAMSGQPVRLSRSERRLVIVRLTRRGEPARVIARKVSLTSRSVARARVRARLLGELEEAA